MSKKLDPTIKVTNAIIRWYSKPKTYVKDGTAFFEDKNDNRLDSWIKDKETAKNICRTCLIGSVKLWSFNLGYAEHDVSDRILDKVDNFVDPDNGFVKNYTALQAKNIFIKVKKELQKEIENG